MDSIIYLLNKWRQKSYHHLPACHFLFYCQGLYTEASWSQLQELQVQTHNMTISFVALFFIVTSNGLSVILHCLVPSPQSLGLFIPRGLCVSDHVVTSEFNDRESLGRRHTGTLGYSRQLVKKQSVTYCFPLQSMRNACSI